MRLQAQSQQLGEEAISALASQDCAHQPAHDQQKRSSRSEPLWDPAGVGGGDLVGEILQFEACFPLAFLNTLQFERFTWCNSYNLFRQQNACNSLCALIKMGVNLFLFKQSISF